MRNDEFKEIPHAGVTEHFDGVYIYLMILWRNETETVEYVLSERF